MDSTTASQCAEITANATRTNTNNNNSNNSRDGIQDVVRQRTGSSATERFSAAQIRKFVQQDPDAWAATERVHLASSFLASVLAGREAPIDVGDGAGMNLLSLATGDWDDILLSATVEGLRAKLPRVVSCDDNSEVRLEVVGSLASYFHKYGFRSDTRVVSWSGDNPGALVGNGAACVGNSVLSLGTSDVLCEATNALTTSAYGHLFGNPTKSSALMSLTVFKNGALARDRVRKLVFFVDSLTHSFPLTKPKVQLIVG